MTSELTCAGCGHRFERDTRHIKRRAKEHFCSVRCRYPNGFDIEKKRARERRHADQYSAIYPKKRKAKRLLRSAIERSAVARPRACEHCGEFPATTDGRYPLHGHHHRGYDNPLAVMWLCVLCHSAEHARMDRARAGMETKP